MSSVAFAAALSKPSPNDTSDSHGNTGVGPNALGSTGTSAGYYNTASGTAALYSNTAGYSNTASGFNALFYNTSGNGNTAPRKQWAGLQSEGSRGSVGDILSEREDEIARIHYVR